MGVAAGGGVAEEQGALLGLGVPGVDIEPMRLAGKLEVQLADPVKGLRTAETGRQSVHLRALRTHEARVHTKARIRLEELQVLERLSLGRARVEEDQDAL